jgi:membrane fusion protein (multidrug efflux system)
MRYTIPCRTGTSRRRCRAGLLPALAVIVSTLMFLVAVPGCKKAEEKKAERATEVTVVTVTPRDVPVSFEYVAQTESSHLVNIFSRVSGFLDRRVYTEGSLVKSGQVLFLMDKKPFQVQVDASAAALARQKAALETSRLNLERTKPLTAQHALSQRDLDDATGAFEASMASVLQAKANLDQAKLNLSYCTITSPVDGITSAALQQDGTYINAPNSKLTTVAVLSPIWVNFSLSENELKRYREQVAKGQIRTPKDGNYEVEVVLVDGSIFPHTGRITYAAPSYNPQTGTFLIRASVLNPDGTLRPNQYVRARVKGAIRPNAVLVPQRAVQQGAKGHFVWVVTKDGKAENRPVVVGDWHGNDWFITEGLRAGEQVVVDGAIALRPGAPVTVKPLTEAAVSSEPGASVQSGETKERSADKGN